VFEQAAELKEVGAGVKIGPNGSRLLIAPGLHQAMERVICQPFALTR
jgi:salicylate hydroxylase